MKRIHTRHLECLLLGCSNVSLLGVAKEGEAHWRSVIQDGSIDGFTLLMFHYLCPRDDGLAAGCQQDMSSQQQVRVMTSWMSLRLRLKTIRICRGDRSYIRFWRFGWLGRWNASRNCVPWQTSSCSLHEDDPYSLFGHNRHRFGMHCSGMFAGFSIWCR